MFERLSLGAIGLIRSRYVASIAQVQINELDDLFVEVVVVIVRNGSLVA